MVQIFALQQIFEKLWEEAREVEAYFADFEEACNCIPRDKLWAMLQYGIDGQLLAGIKSLCMHSEICVHRNSVTTKPFRVNIGLRQICFVSPILFLICVDRVVQNSESCGGVKVGDCIFCLLFVDDLVLLDSTLGGLS